jgi:hypothetical protein
MNHKLIDTLPIIDNKDKKMIRIITDKDTLKVILRIRGITTSYYIPSTFNVTFEERQEENKRNNFRNSL